LKTIHLILALELRLLAGEWVIVLTIYFKRQRENVLVEELKSAFRDCLEEIKQAVS